MSQSHHEPLKAKVALSSVGTSSSQPVPFGFKSSHPMMATVNHNVLAPISPNVPMQEFFCQGLASRTPLGITDENSIVDNRMKPEDQGMKGFSRQVSTDADIMSALQKSCAEPDLIGDFTVGHALPLISGKHQDLKSISAETLAALMKGEYQDAIQDFTIVDCRYPYEYAGGHISGSVNVYTQDSISERFFNENIYLAEQQQPASPVLRCKNQLFNLSHDSLMSTPEKMNVSLSSESPMNTTVNIESSAVMESPLVEKAPLGPPKRSALVFHCEFSSKRAPKL